jgi:hypothetical protein
MISAIYCSDGRLVAAIYAVSQVLKQGKFLLTGMDSTHVRIGTSVQI